MTLFRLPDWQNDRSIWTAEQRIEPDNPWAMSRLGRAMLGDGEDEKGLQLWRDAVAAPEGIQLFVLQEERLLLAQSSLALHEQGRMPAATASALAMQMGCEIIHAHEEAEQPLPAEPTKVLGDDGRQCLDCGCTRHQRRSTALLLFADNLLPPLSQSTTGHIGGYQLKMVTPEPSLKSCRPTM